MRLYSILSALFIGLSSAVSLESDNIRIMSAVALAKTSVIATPYAAIVAAEGRDTAAPPNHASNLFGRRGIQEATVYWLR